MEGTTNLSKVKVYLVSMVYVIVSGAIFFLSAGSLRYWEAWVYCSIILVQTISINAYFLKNDPKLIKRRSQREKEPIQKVIVTSLLLLLVVGYLIAGLDYRYLWSAVPVWIILASNAIFFLGGIFLFFVLRENSYASSAIQVEKEQKVIMTGPYAVIRHPMYLEFILVNLVTPFALGSYWALIPFLLSIPLIILRLINEEQLLLQDLPGYKDYCLKTRYRLIPAIW